MISFSPSHSHTQSFSISFRCVRSRDGNCVYVGVCFSVVESGAFEKLESFCYGYKSALFTGSALEICLTRMRCEDSLNYY